jgi:signal transduction histidine kinase
LFDEQKQIIGLVGFGRDITERKRSVEMLLKAKERAEESDRLKTAFLQNISHEIRTPMNAIVGFSGFLSDSDLSKEKRDYYTDIIIQSSNQLLSIITDIVNIATIEAGQEKVLEKEMNLNSMFKLLQKQFFLKARKQNIALSIKTMLPDADASIITDGTKLTEILTNLIGNALKFTKQGSINLGYNIISEQAVEQGLVPKQSQQLQFFVEDTGIGIPPELQEDIFKRFHQAELTANREFGGSGLGLSISKAYVELLGGKIWVDSEPCKGSIFYFTIPYKRGGQQMPKPERPMSETKTGMEEPKTLLIAEDEDNNFMLLEELLSGMNFNIIRAINGVKAVEICKGNPNIDLVLMDIKMPIMNGFDATKQIKELRPHLPVIAQTAYSTEADKNKALACGCSDFISKPFKRELLISVIHQQLVH